MLQVFLEDAALALEGGGGRVSATTATAGRVVVGGGTVAQSRGLRCRRLALGRRPRWRRRRSVVAARVRRRRLALGRRRRRGGRRGVVAARVLHLCGVWGCVGGPGEQGKAEKWRTRQPFRFPARGSREDADFREQERNRTKRVSF